MPNLSFHTLRYPVAMDPFYAIQWPMMWADNFTVARHVLVFDTESPPVLPLRCHLLFGENQRPLWASWPNLPGLRWVRVSDALLLQLVRGVEQGP